ncbi:putative phage tail assembly chaperone [Photobacterium makurazakiensis]|uniref:putative phage tail assembly chaperone n=1 Tax=Photobacterium makurazakiensis TaxID=2910234 RepID=UPI003D0B0F00
MKEQRITLTVGEHDLHFNVGSHHYDDYMNEMMPDNKVAPAHNFCFSTIDDKSKDTLRTITDANPSAAIQICAAVQERFAPKLDITVKK